MEGVLVSLYLATSSEKIYRAVRLIVSAADKPVKADLL
jgi:hypothetical protein